MQGAIRLITAFGLPMATTLAGCPREWLGEAARWLGVEDYGRVEGEL
jgi:hypothetical protein